MISHRLKQILKDRVDDLKNNNLDHIFKYLNTLDTEALRDFLINQGIDPLRYVTEIPSSYYELDSYDALDLSSYTNIKSIDDYAFYRASIKTPLVLPQSIQKLENSSFEHVYVHNLNLPEGIKEIPTECFFESRISELKIPNSVSLIDRSAFAFATINTLYLPNNLKKATKGAFKNFKGSIIYKGKKYDAYNIIDILKNNGVKII